MNSQQTLSAPAPSTPAREAPEVWNLPDDWRWILQEPAQRKLLAELGTKIARERRTHSVYPAAEHVFQALVSTRWAAVRVVILGQDPYHGPGQAHGLSFSVPPGVPLPPSLRNIFRELHDDLGLEIPVEGCLEPWAQQGVLLLNATLTVRAGQANSHSALGWAEFTDTLLRQISAAKPRCVFVLWGNFAKRKAELLDSRHPVFVSAHPSPLSARHGFFGSRIFSRCNQALQTAGLEQIDWRLPRLDKTLDQVLG